MINTALEPLYSRVFSYRERIYKYFLPVLITKCISFIPRQHSSRCFTVLIVTCMLFIYFVYLVSFDPDIGEIDGK